MKRLPPLPSPRALRKAATCTRNAPSSTTVSGQVRAMSWSRGMVSPARSTSATRMSNARLPRRRGVPPSSSNRCIGISRNDPKAKVSSSIGESSSRTQLISGRQTLQRRLEVANLGVDRGGILHDQLFLVPIELALGLARHRERAGGGDLDPAVGVLAQKLDIADLDRTSRLWRRSYSPAS